MKTSASPSLSGASRSSSVGGGFPDRRIAQRRRRDTRSRPGKCARAEVSNSQGARYVCRPAVSSVADMTTSRRSGRPLLLQLERAGERDVAVEMALVELVEEDRADAGQRGIGEHLAEQHAFGDEADAGARGDDLIEPNLVADFLARASRRAPAPRGPRACAWPAGAVAGRRSRRLREAVVEQDLRDLRGFARAGRRLEHEARLPLQRGHEVPGQLEDRKVAHGETKPRRRYGEPSATTVPSSAPITMRPSETAGDDVTGAPRS